MTDISLNLAVSDLGDYLSLSSSAPLGLREIAEAIGMPFPVSGLSCRTLGTRLAKARTLEVQADPPPDHEGQTWSADIVGGHTWLADADGPEFAWVQVEASSEEYDTPVVALAGTVINPETSTSDFPFTHPFGTDWECYVDVDPKFRGVLSPVNGASGESDYKTAANQALYAPKTGSHQGVLGIEWEGQLVPSPFRPAAGDRIALFGRWVLDAGHNFHTEMHPPLLMVSANAPGQQPDGGVWTQATITSRPYLVSQAWPEGSFRAHLENEIEKIPLHSLRIEAHPTVWPVPFSGRQSMTMFLRTSIAPPPGKPLQVQYALTARSGVSVAMSPAPPDGVQISITFDPAAYQAAPLPPKNEISISPQTLLGEAGLPPAVATLGELMAFVASAGLLEYNAWLGALTGVAAAIVAEGIKTDSYTMPESWQPSAAPALTTADVAGLGGAASVTLDNEQPYPLYGWVNVGWG
jgi:hypothetical protein